MQGAYYQEAIGMKSLKMYNLSRCKRRTKLYGNLLIFATNPTSVQRLH